MAQKIEKLTPKDFRGLLAPVFTCFKQDEDCSLQLKYIDRYAKWLKSHDIVGVMVNGIIGEGPALGLNERKLNAEAWWRACVKYELLMIVQIGGAPLPDVTDLAQHAERLGVHGVLCLPELFYKPRDINQLVGYCKIIAKNCLTRPFFYYHIPRFTNVEFDMNDFCTKAEKAIPNFFGIQYSSRDLDMGLKCLREGRVVLLGSGTLLAPGLLLGFESCISTFLNIRPEIGWKIYDAMNSNNMIDAKKLQIDLNQEIIKESEKRPLEYVDSMKNWFNVSMAEKVGFSAGPARRFY